MKKNLAIVLSLTIFVLLGCGNFSTSIPESRNATSPTLANLPLPTATLFPSATPLPIQPHGIINSLDSFVTAPDGYILYGNYSWTDTSVYGVGLYLAGIKDADGMEISWEYADVKDSTGAVIPFEGANSGVYPDLQKERQWYWAYKVTTINFVAPISLSFVLTAIIPADGGSFTFDPGPNPQLGQTWEINQDVLVNNETIHVLSAEQGGIEKGFFLFTMQTDSNIVSAAITDLANPHVGGGGGGGGIPVAGVPFKSDIGYQLPLPQGTYTLTFTNVTVLVSGDWILNWNP